MEEFVHSAGAMKEATVARFRAELARATTLPAVFAWLAAQKPPRAITEIVTQDEFTHDMVVAFDPDVALVFEAT